MKCRHDDVLRVWLYIKVAAHLEGMRELDYRRWLLKRFLWCHDKPLVRTLSERVVPRHDWWQYRRDDWAYVHETSLTPPAYARLLRLRARRCTAAEMLEDDVTGREAFYLHIPDGQDEIERSLRLSLVDIALTWHLPGLIGHLPPARALDVRPDVPLRTLHAASAKKIFVLQGLSSSALLTYNMKLEDIKTGVAERADLSKAAADRAVKAFIAELTDALTTGDGVTVPGFGTFKVEHRAAKNGINPQTKERMTIPARKAPVFRAAPALRQAVNA